MMRRIERENTGLLKPGQDLLVAGYAGLSGTLSMVREKREELRRWFSAEYLDHILGLERFLTEKEAGYWARMGATEWEPSGLGGIFSAIWNLTGGYETGAVVYLRRIPIRQETIEICERLDCNPYRLYSRGCCLLTAVSGSQLSDELAKDGILSVTIGRIHSGIAREIYNGDGHGYLERPQPDEILKVIPDFRE